MVKGALPVIGITMGDPTGIGPEIIVKAITQNNISSYGIPVVFGDKGVLRKTLNELRISAEVQVVENFRDLKPSKKIIYVKNITNLNIPRLKYGKPDKNCGKAMVNYIRHATIAAMNKEIDGIVTAPINKQAMNNAGFKYAGHTELMAELTNTEDYAMMLAGPKLRVVLATTHIPLREVSMKLTPGKLVKILKLTCLALLELFGIKNPRIGVTGLNPHGGEGGLFGYEERELIVPAVNNAKNMGINVRGPYPADTIFHFALKGEYDAVVAMYHDQGLIPLKLVHFTDAVNITLGLPIIRTSVDHGTAYDIAGKGIANPHSLVKAFKMACEMAVERRNFHLQKEVERKNRRRRVF